MHERGYYGWKPQTEYGIYNSLYEQGIASKPGYHFPLPVKTIHFFRDSNLYQHWPKQHSFWTNNATVSTHAGPPDAVNAALKAMKTPPFFYQY